uniref:Methyltransferase type 11 domain-containing protein n=1 Tax=Magnetococcus massalia (strain MO-1) TaxID=451514 RepID=A0A1S7LL12_MAGMO|nr:Protein of unknown function. Containing SAM-dependent methyltransferase domain [Candidatus Magnetococcus massalia]
MEMRDKPQLNKAVAPFLTKYQCGDFKLDEKGCQLVYEANKNLDKSYAKQHTTPLSTHFYKRIEKFIQTVPPQKYGIALDACCGTGQLSLNIMKYHLFEQCYAVDISRPSVELLEKRVKNEGISGVIPMVANVMDSSFDDHYFDCVMGSFFLHHLPDNQAFFREMFRVIKPGGVICMTGEPGIASDHLESFLSRKIDRLFSLFKRGESSRQEKSPQKNQPDNIPVLSDIWIYNERDIVRMMGEVGFTEISINSWGRLQCMGNHLVNYLWFKMFDNNQPALVSRFMQIFHVLDKILFSTHPTDAFCYLRISARKPSLDNDKAPTGR